MSRHPELDTIRYCIRSYIFTASSSPMMVASTRKALQILQSEPGLRRQLWDNAERLYSGLQALGLPIGPSPSPVVTVSLDDRARAINCWNALMEAGIYVNLVVPPASPSTNFLLRNSVSAAHSSAQIDTMIEEAIASSNASSIKDMGKVMGQLKPKLQGRADMGAVSGKINGSQFRVGLYEEAVFILGDFIKLGQGVHLVGHHCRSQHEKIRSDF